MPVVIDKRLDSNEATRLLYEFKNDVKKGLAAEQKCIPSRYLYDDEGSKLFQKIMDLPEYYLFNAEKEIIETYSSFLAAMMGTEAFNLAELGAGDGRKTKILLESFAQHNLDFTFTVIDISRKALQEFMLKTNQWNKNCPFKCVNADYAHGLQQIHKQSGRKTMILFLGSSIGNFSAQEEICFLRELRTNMDEKDYLLIGFDVASDPRKIMAAYDDEAGVTGEFNLNLLKRINRELKANFDLKSFRHAPVYIPEGHFMESYLESMTEQEVHIDEIDMTVHFSAGESIKTEISRKYTQRTIGNLAAGTGFKTEADFYDRKRNFVLSLWRPDGCRQENLREVKKMQAVWQDIVLAGSDETEVVEGNHYFPPESVDMINLRKSGNTYTCPWKGKAHYYDIVVDGEVKKDGAWIIPEPKEAAKNIQGFVAFSKGVEVTSN